MARIILTMTALWFSCRGPFKCVCSVVQHWIVAFCVKTRSTLYWISGPCFTFYFLSRKKSVLVPCCKIMPLPVRYSKCASVCIVFKKCLFSTSNITLFPHPNLDVLEIGTGTQCCGSEMFIPDPGSGFFPSRIQGQTIPNPDPYQMPN